MWGWLNLRGRPPLLLAYARNHPASPTTSIPINPRTPSSISASLDCHIIPSLFRFGRGRPSLYRVAKQ
jgi:hypothetical protein